MILVPGSTACTAGELRHFIAASGTRVPVCDGRLKGVMLTRESLLPNARTDPRQFTKHAMRLYALPMFHTHGLFLACNVMLPAGETPIFLPGFDHDAVIAGLPGATALMGVHDVRGPHRPPHPGTPQA